MNQEDPKQGSRLDSRAVPVAIASVSVIVLGVLLTYLNTTFGAVIVLVGLCGVVWLGSIAAKSPPRE